MQDSKTRATKALVEGLFAAYEQGDFWGLFDHVADDVHWTVTGDHALSGEYHSKSEFLEATFGRIQAVLKEPVEPSVRRITAEGDVAVVEWHGRSTSIADRPYDNDYCWVVRVDGDRIVEVTAYLDSKLVEDLFRTTGG